MTIKRLSKTGIEYGEYNWSFYPGCLHKPQGKCPVPSCWAEGMWKRHMAAEAKKGITLPDFHHPHLIPELLLAPLSIKKPSTILVNFMGDLFGDWVDPDMLVRIGEIEQRDTDLEITLKEQLRLTIESCPQHTFLFLTKNPEGLVPWGPFPDNAWVGATVCNQKMFDKAAIYLSDVQAKHKWLSIEPLLGEIPVKPIDLTGNGIDWVVIGAQSQPTKYPETDWVENIIWACLDAHVPVWLKNNLAKGLPPAPPFYIPPVLPAHKGTPMTYRQERPF